MILSWREKLLILALGGLLAVTGVFFALRAMNGYQADQAAALEARLSTLRRLEAAASELERLSRSSPAQARRQSLIGYVERLAEGVNLKEKVQLNQLAQELVGLEGVEIRLNDLTLDELVQFLYTLENADQQLVVDQMEISPSFRSRNLLRLSLRVLAQQP